MLSILAVEVSGLGDFCRAYGIRPSIRDYARLVLGLLPYQAVLSFAAARAIFREARGVRGWEKTTHLGLHLTQRADDAVGDRTEAIIPALAGQEGGGVPVAPGN
jgi:hypothetical protein